jgi:signal transduction histidine kinase
MDVKKNEPKLFGLYERFHSHVEGKGLGLYLVKQQVDALGGSIQVESTIEQGSSFTIKLSAHR